MFVDYFHQTVNELSVAGSGDTYVASSLSFLPRNIASLHQPEMYPPPPVAGTAASSTMDEEGGSTPVLDEPDDDDVAVGPNYSTPVVRGDNGQLSLQQNLSGRQQAGNPEFAYRIVHVNDDLVGSRPPDDNSSAAAPAPGTFGPDGTMIYRTEVVDGFQSASEAFHPPPDFFRSEADFSVPPPPGTIYQVKDEGYGPAAEKVPVLSSSTRDVVYTVVSTMQQPAPASFYPVVIEVPSFTEPPPKISTFPPPPSSFIPPPPAAVFNPSLPPPSLPPTNLPPPSLPPPPVPTQPVSLQYTVPPLASIQVVVPPQTLRSPLPAPPKSHSLYIPQHSASGHQQVPTVRTSLSSSGDRKTVSDTLYRPESVLQGIRHLRDVQQKDDSASIASAIPRGIRRLRDIQQKDDGSSIASAIPTVDVNVVSQRQAQQKLPMRKLPVAGKPVPPLITVRQLDEAAWKPKPSGGLSAEGRQHPGGGRGSASFAGGKRRISGSFSDDSLPISEPVNLLHDSELELDVGPMDDLAGHLGDEILGEEIVSDEEKDYEYVVSVAETMNRIPSLLDSKLTPRAPMRGGSIRSGSMTGRGPRLFEVRESHPVPSFMRQRMPRMPMPRIPRMSGSVFRRGPRQFWNNGQ